MQKDYEHILRGFDLTTKEAKLLSDTEDLIEQMYNEVMDVKVARDLEQVIKNAREAIRVLNPRLNVNTTLKKED